MARSPSIQWYYKQYLGDNDVLKMEWDASGMHAWLLNLSIQEEPPGSIPNDIAAIRRWLRNPSDDVWRRVQPQIFAAWKFRDGRWYNDGMVRSCQRRDNFKARYENGTKTVRESPETLRRLKIEPAFEVDVGSKTANSDELIPGIVRLHPANWHLKDALQLPQAQLAAVMEAILRNGKELVEQGTMICAKIAAKYPLARQKMIPGPRNFWGLEAHYLKSEEYWEAYLGGDGDKLSKTEQRVTSNRAAILEGLGIANYAGRDAGPSSQGENLRTDARRSKALAAGAGPGSSRSD